MSTSPVSTGSAAPVPKPVPPKIDTDQAVPRRAAGWQSYTTPILVVILAFAVVITITRNWNAWEGGKVEQVTDDAYVRGDLTPLSTKVAGHCSRCKRDRTTSRSTRATSSSSCRTMTIRRRLIRPKRQLKLHEPGLKKIFASAQLQDARIEKALAGIDQAKAQIAAAEAGKELYRPSWLHARSERKRQEGLYQNSFDH